MFEVFILFHDDTIIKKEFPFFKDVLNYLSSCDYSDIYYVNINRFDFNDEIYNEE